MKKVMNSDMLRFLNMEAKRADYEHHLSPFMVSYIDPEGIHVIATDLNHGPDVKHCYVLVKAKGMRVPVEAQIDLDRENWERLPVYDELMDLEEEFNIYNRRVSR